MAGEPLVPNPNARVSLRIDFKRPENLHFIEFHNQARRALALDALKGAPSDILIIANGTVLFSEIPTQFDVIHGIFDSSGVHRSISRSDFGTERSPEGERLNVPLETVIGFHNSLAKNTNHPELFIDVEAA